MAITIEGKTFRTYEDDPLWIDGKRLSSAHAIVDGKSTLVYPDKYPYRVSVRCIRNFPLVMYRPADNTIYTINNARSEANIIDAEVSYMSEFPFAVLANGTLFPMAPWGVNSQTIVERRTGHIHPDVKCGVPYYYPDSPLEETQHAISHEGGSLSCSIDLNARVLYDLHPTSSDSDTYGLNVSPLRHANVLEIPYTPEYRVIAQPNWLQKIFLYAGDGDTSFVKGGLWPLDINFSVQFPGVAWLWWNRKLREEDVFFRTEVAIPGYTRDEVTFGEARTRNNGGLFMLAARDE